MRTGTYNNMTHWRVVKNTSVPKVSAGLVVVTNKRNKRLCWRRSVHCTAGSDMVVVGNLNRVHSNRWYLPTLLSLSLPTTGSLASWCWSPVENL